jgi:hypothetical protein
MLPLQAHCHRGLGTLYATAGRLELAHTALSTAIDLYCAMDLIFWLPQAEAALGQVSRAGVAGQAQLSAAIPLLDPLS